jgi:hypothetical protein
MPTIRSESGFAPRRSRASFTEDVYASGTTATKTVDAIPDNQRSCQIRPFLARLGFGRRAFLVEVIEVVAERVGYCSLAIVLDSICRMPPRVTL